MKILSAPVLKSMFERVCMYYVRLRLKNDAELQKEEREHYKYMNKFLKHRPLNLGSDFNERDAKALKDIVHLALKEKMMVVEVGSWTGHSTSVLAESVMSHGGHVYAVDHWRGNEGVVHHGIAEKVDMFHVFKHNMMVLGVWSAINPLVMSSRDAVNIFADGILDLVFIDADHRYDYIKEDIALWLPKIKAGGILCGHDSEGYYSKYPEETKQLIDNHINEDYVSHMHCGIIKLLYDVFRDKHTIMPDSIVWYFRKEH
jgi:predicted O-methyltransferase YrrM